MSLRPWKKRSEAIVHSNLWWTYKRDGVMLPSGAEGEYHYVDSRGSSMVIPILQDGRLLLVNQYRYLAERESIEFPCGSVKPGSTHDQCAWTELMEETGYSSDSIVQIGEFNPYNGVTNEMCHVYIARNLKHVGSVHDETEEFELVVMSDAEIDERIKAGTIWDGMTIAGWYLAKAKGLV
jgi:ADP-ribose pyrophosphatase